LRSANEREGLASAPERLAPGMTPASARVLLYTAPRRSYRALPFVEKEVDDGRGQAEGLSKLDLQRRAASKKEKELKLKSPNFFVSTTRLSVHNLPLKTDEKALKKIFLDAVKRRATKEQPVVKQAKVLRCVPSLAGTQHEAVTGTNWSTLAGSERHAIGGGLHVRVPAFSLHSSFPSHHGHTAGSSPLRRIRAAPTHADGTQEARD
jgi:hypothetical protein